MKVKVRNPRPFPKIPKIDGRRRKDKMVEDLLSTIEAKSGGSFEYDVTNCDRSIGARVSGEIAERHGNPTLHQPRLLRHASTDRGRHFQARRRSGRHPGQGHPGTTVQEELRCGLGSIPDH